MLVDGEKNRILGIIAAFEQEGKAFNQSMILGRYIFLHGFRFDPGDLFAYLRDLERDGYLKLAPGLVQPTYRMNLPEQEEESK